MIARGIIILGAVIALLLGALPGLVVFLSVTGATVLLASAAHRGYYRSNR